MAKGFLFPQKDSRSEYKWFFDFQKVFSDNSSTEYKTIPAIKEEVETANFHQYQGSGEQKNLSS